MHVFDEQLENPLCADTEDRAVNKKDKIPDPMKLGV